MFVSQATDPLFNYLRSFLFFVHVVLVKIAEQIFKRGHVFWNRTSDPSGVNVMFQANVFRYDVSAPSAAAH